jgi:hypothetical protein
MENLTSSSNAQSEYLVLQFSYTTAEIQETKFSGETPDPFRFAAPQLPPEENLPVVVTVIDGEPRVVRNEVPPGARRPDPSSRLFELGSNSG